MEGNTNLNRPTPPPLPANRSELLAQRKSLKDRTLNNDVEDIHVRLWDEVPLYRSYLDALWREDTVEGSFIADDLQAANIIRKYADECGDTYYYAKKAKLMSIMHSLHVVCRRYTMSRQERQKMVGGQSVGPSPHDEYRDAA